MIFRKYSNISDLNIPNVFFNDEKTQLAVSDWLGIIPPGQKKMTKIQKKETQEKMGHLLQTIGVDESETCDLKKDEEDNDYQMTFSCHFHNLNKDAKIILTFGDFYENMPELTIDYENGIRHYEYYKRDNKLNLRDYTIKIDNNKSYSRGLYSNSAYFKLEDDLYKLLITIDAPSNKIETICDTDEFRLKNECEFEQYLLGLPLPLNIADICEILSEIPLESIKDYPSLKIELRKKKSKNDYEIIDGISLEYGFLCEFNMTKSGRTVSIKQDKSSMQDWQQPLPGLTIGQTDGMFYYINPNKYIKHLEEQPISEGVKTLVKRN